jgi:hypothetical protein
MIISYSLEISCKDFGRYELGQVMHLELTCSIACGNQLVSSQKMIPYTQPDQPSNHEIVLTGHKTPGFTQMVVQRNL